MLITLLAYGAVALAAKNRPWMLAPSGWQVAAFVGIGLSITGLIEWLATNGRWVKSWAYSTSMPLFPGTGIGLAPLLQWIVVPLLVLWFVGRHWAGGSFMKTMPVRGRRGLLVALGAATVTPLCAGCANRTRDASTSSEDAIQDPGFVAPPEGTQRRIALVLSGGAARGFAHIGVSRVLEREGLRPDLVVGSSVGAIVGAMCASGMTADEIERAALKIDWTVLFDFNPVRAVQMPPRKQKVSRRHPADSCLSWLPDLGSNRGILEAQKRWFSCRSTFVHAVILRASALPK